MERPEASNRPPVYDSEVREQAVRMVAQVRSSYSSETEAIRAVSSILGIHDAEILRKWLHPDETASGTSRRQGSKWRLLKTIWMHPLVTGVVIAVLGGLGLTYSQFFLGVNRQVPHLELDEISLSPPSVGQLGLNVNPLKIDIKLLNTGKGLAIINDAKLVIQKFATLPLCNSEGSFTSTGTYAANMPIDPRPGQVVDIPVSQLVEAGGADRFDVQLSTPALRHGMRYSLYIYQVHLYLEYNLETRPIDLGEALIDLPLPPVAGEFYWTKFYAEHPEFMRNAVYAPDIPNYMKCATKNSQTLHFVLSWPGIRTADLAAIPPTLKY